MTHLAMDDRQPWEISYCIRINFAGTFLKYLTVEGHERAMLQMAYRCDNLHQWAREKINEILRQAKRERNGRQLSTVARSVVHDSSVTLAVAGLFGIVPIPSAATMRIDAKGPEQAGMEL